MAEGLARLSMCKHRKMPRRALSCSDVGADQGLRLSVNRTGVGKGGGGVDKVGPPSALPKSILSSVKMVVN